VTSLARMGDLEFPDAHNLRISDEDRHKVADILREAAGEGRIDFEELDERLEATYAAKTYADLVPITVDLPAHPASRTVTPRAAGLPAAHQTERHLAIMSGIERRGTWSVPEHFIVLALMGGADLDFRQAQFPGREVVITVNAVMGGAEITVNPRTRVIVEGVGIMGGYSGPHGKVPEELDADSPVLRIRGFALMGGVSVTRKPVKPRPALS
jgi:hypothetical protein